MYDIQWATTVAPAGPDGMDGLIGAIAEAGYSGLELAGQLIRDRNHTDAMRALCYKHQIAPVSATTQLHPDGDTAAIYALIDSLDELGAEILVVSWPPRPGSSERPFSHPDDTITTLQGIGERCAEFGLKVALRTTSVENAQTLEEIGAQVSADLLGFEMDPSLIAELGLDPPEFLRRWEDRANYLSLPLSLFTAPVQLKPLAAALDEIGFSGWATVSCPSGSASSLAGPLSNARACLKSAFGM